MGEATGQEVVYISVGRVDHRGIVPRLTPTVYCGVDEVNCG